MINTLADITPGGVATPLITVSAPSQLPITCRWVILSAPSANAGDLRYGDSSTGAARGSVLPKGTSIILPISTDQRGDTYALAGIYVYGTGSDKVGISYGS